MVLALLTLDSWWKRRILLPFPRKTTATAKFSTPILQRYGSDMLINPQQVDCLWWFDTKKTQPFVVPIGKTPCFDPIPMGSMAPKDLGLEEVGVKTDPKSGKAGEIPQGMTWWLWWLWWMTLGDLVKLLISDFRQSARTDYRGWIQPHQCREHLRHWCWGPRGYQADLDNLDMFRRKRQTNQTRTPPLRIGNSQGQTVDLGMLWHDCYWESSRPRSGAETKVLFGSCLCSHQWSFSIFENTPSRSFKGYLRVSTHLDSFGSIWLVHGSWPCPHF